MEEREGKRKNFHDLKGHGSSLLELQHLVFMLHNASTNNVTTDISCPNSPEGSGVGEWRRGRKKANAKPGLYNRDSSVQKVIQGLDYLGGGFCGEDCLYICKALQCFQAGGKCRNLFIRLCITYSCYLTAWMQHCHCCMKYSGDYLVINCLIRTGDESCLAFNPTI